MVKVLVVEDEPMVARTVERNLGLIGKGRFECVNVNSITTARNYLENQRVDVILLDLGLPDSNGLDSLDAAVSIAGDIPIIVQTGGYDEKLAEEAILRGAAEFFYKTDADTNALLRSIKYAVERAKIQRKLKLKGIVFETSITANTCADANGLLDTVNQAFLDMWRYESVDDLAGMPMSVMFEDPEEVVPVFETIDRDGKWEGELIARRNDGSTFITKIYATTVHNDSGTFIGYQAACVDVTQQKEAEEALRKEKARAQNYLDIAGVMIVALNLKGEITLINKKGCAVLGFDEEDVIGKNWFDHFIPESVKAEISAVSRTLLGGDINSVEYYENPVITRNGEERLIAWNNTLLRDEDGNIIGHLSSGSDITERKKAEEELRKHEQRLFQFLEAIPVGVFVVLADGGEPYYANKTAKEIMGRPIDLETPLGSLADLYEVYVAGTDDPYPTERMPIVRAMSGEISSVDDMEIRRPEDTILLHVTASPVYDANGNIKFSIAAFIDITERNKMELELAQARKLEAIGQLAAGIAHEINTPAQYVGNNTTFLQDTFGALVSVLTHYENVCQQAKAGGVTAEMISETERVVEEADLEYLKEEIPVAIEQSLDGVNRVSEIVMAMKEFSHPGVDEKVPVDINHALQTTLTVSRSEWKYIAEVVKKFDENLPNVPCLPGEFNQAVLNIIVNAAHAIGDKLGRDSEERGLIQVSTAQVDGFAEIRIQDDGPGIPERIQHRIMEPFFTTKEVGRGTGQGLSISRSIIVDKHNGEFRFDTEEGVGTTFIIRLPLHPKEEDKA